MTQRFIRLPAFCIPFILFLTLCFTGVAISETRWISGAQSGEILSIKADPIRNRVYYGDAVTNRIVIIDTETEAIIGSIQVTGKPYAMDVSKDGKILAVASSNLSIVDLDTLSVIQVPIAIAVASVAFDYAGVCM